MMDEEDSESPDSLLTSVCVVQQQSRVRKTGRRHAANATACLDGTRPVWCHRRRGFSKTHTRRTTLTSSTADPSDHRRLYCLPLTSPPGDVLNAPAHAPGGPTRTRMTISANAAVAVETSVTVAPQRPVRFKNRPRESATGGPATQFWRSGARADTRHARRRPLCPPTQRRGRVFSGGRTTAVASVAVSCSIVQQL